MSKCILISLLLFSGFHMVYGQSFLQSYPSVVGLNLGNADAIEGLGMSSLASPSLGLLHSKWQVAASYRQYNFGDYPLSHFQGGFRLSFREIQHIGLQLNYSGNSAVGIFQLSALYGRKLFRNLNLGVQFNYGQRHIDHYETADQMSLDVALSSEAVNGLHLGAWARHLFQINGASLENASLLVSAKYHLNEDFRIYTSFYSSIASDLIVGTGIYYQILDQLDLKLSYMPNQSAFALGFGMNVRQNWGIHSAAYLQPSFGIQPALGAYYHH